MKRGVGGTMGPRARTCRCRKRRQVKRLKNSRDIVYYPGGEGADYGIGVHVVKITYERRLEALH